MDNKKQNSHSHNLPDKNSLSYESLGASADKAGLHQILTDLNMEAKEKLFCQVIPDIAGDEDYYSFIHCDGAGTKGIIAYLWYKETGDTSYFSRLAEDSLVMNLDDVFCLGIPDKIILANAIARNSRLIPNEAIKAVIQGYELASEKLKKYGINIELSGGETADCGDTVRTLLVDATATGRIKKSNIINPANITAGDVIVGFSSSGTTNYDSHNNSGIGSNGLTLARHCILTNNYLKNYPEIVDTGLDLKSVYQGDYKVKDTPYPLNTSIGDALSSPTRSYAPVLKAMLEEYKEKIHGIIHLTGGAHGKVLRFIKNLKIIKDALPSPPPIFDLIKVGGRVQIEEMYRVFNMGIRLEIYTDAVTANKLIEISNSFGLNAYLIGRVESDSKPNVEIRLNEVNFTYQL